MMNCIWGTFFAPGLHIARDDEVDHFIQSAEKLKAQVDKERSRFGFKR